MAFSVVAACAWAWIATLLINAGEIMWTFRADHTFWTTGWWCATVALQARADGTFASNATHAVGSAWAGFAWILRWCFWWNERVNKLIISIDVMNELGCHFAVLCYLR